MTLKTDLPWEGPTWKCEALLDTGFLVIREHTERIDGERVARRFARIGHETLVWDFMRWLRDVLQLDTDIIVELPGMGDKFVI